MRRTAVLFPVIACLLTSVLAACNSASSTAAAQSPAPARTAASTAATSAAAPATSAAARSSSAAPAATTALDPCQLVTSAEASSLAGTTFGQGKDEPTGTGGRRCVYGSQTPNVFTVIVGQAATVADADAQWSSARSEAQSAVTKQVPPGASVSLHTADLTGLADKAALASGGATIEGRKLNEIAIYLLKGTTFLTFSDLVLDSGAPGEAAMKAEAQTALSRVP
jgi:hypothetical protein